MYVCFLLNNVSSGALGGAVPIQVLTGSTNDISPLLYFVSTILSITKSMTLIFRRTLVRNAVVGLALPNMLGMP